MNTRNDLVVSGLPGWDLARGPVWEKQSLKTSAGSLTRTELDIITADYRLHKSMLTSNTVEPLPASPYCYVRFAPAGHQVATVNSSESLLGLAEAYYTQAHQQLDALRDETDEDGDTLMEDAALDTAKEILGLLQKANYAPPELSWHGGDAVVMLWAAGDMTYAITVTDGEWGYVARRGSNQIRIGDSLKLERFALEDLR